MELVFYFGLGVFGLSSLYFYIQGSQKLLNTAFLVSFVTFISYAIMLLSFRGEFFLAAGPEGTFYTRWIFYGLSCALLVYEMAKRIGYGTEKTAGLIYATVAVMVLGAFSALGGSDLAKWTFFGLSSVAYLLLIKDLVFFTDAKDKENSGVIKLYVGLFWTLFPIFFLIAPAGMNLISAEISQGLYLGLDVATKIIFYFAIGYFATKN